MSLASLGYSSIVTCSDHVFGLRTLEKEHITHIIFNATKTNMPVLSFAEQALEMVPSLILIPSSYDPRVDDVWGLMQRGATGYLVKPFTADSLDHSVVMATVGEKVADVVLQSKERNKAFAELIASRLDLLATAERQFQSDLCTPTNVEFFRDRLKESVNFGQTFGQGQEDELVEALIEIFLARAAGPASRLGRIRDRLKGKRVQPSDTP